MTYFSPLLYTSISEIPALSYTWSLKKIPLSGGASPYEPSYGVPPRENNSVTYNINYKSPMNQKMDISQLLR